MDLKGAVRTGNNYVKGKDNISDEGGVDGLLFRSGSFDPVFLQTPTI